MRILLLFVLKVVSNVFWLILFCIKILGLFVNYFDIVKFMFMKFLFWLVFNEMCNDESSCLLRICIMFFMLLRGLFFFRMILEELKILYLV